MYLYKTVYKYQFAKSKHNMRSILEIRNFGAIKELSVELNKMMVFIGTQGTGKSTVAKLLTIFNDLFWLRTLVYGKDVMKEFAVLGISNYFQSDSFIKYSDETNTIIYQEGKFSLTIDGVNEDNHVKFINQVMAVSVSSMLKKSGVADTEEEVEKYIDENIALLRANFRTLCYIPTERNMIGILSKSLANIMLNNIPLSMTLLEYLALYEKAQAQFPTYSQPFLGVSFSSEKADANICVDKSSDKWLKLSECSSGVQSTLPMLMILDYAYDVKCFDRFVIEEPEINLFPRNQYELTKEIVYHSSRNNNSQFILNTHSPYLLTSLNVLIMAAKLGKNEKYRDVVEEIIPSKYWIDSEDVSVFSLGEGDGDYCKNLKNPRTGLISGNPLDSASEYINSDFSRLYQLFVKSLKDE